MSATARNGPDKKPFLRTSNVLWDEIDLSSLDKMSIPDHELPAKLLRRGDLLVCEGGEIGRAAIWNGEVKTMSFQNHLHRLRPIDTNVEPRFYVFFLQSAFTQLGFFEGAGNRTTIPNLSRSRLAGLHVPQPSLSEQQAIVRLLGDIRQAIRGQEQSISIARELKRASMGRLFARGLHSEMHRETEIGSVPKSWGVVPLGSLCISADSVAFQSEADRTIQYVDVSSISRDYLRIETTSRYVLREAPSRARKRILAGDVIFATVRPTLLRAAIVPEELDNQVCSTAFCVLRRDRKKVVNGFAYYLVQREQFLQRLAESETGASYPAVTDRMVKETLVPRPALNEQREIVAILNAIDCKIDLQCRKRAVLEELFKALLHNLMIGEIRAADIDLSALSSARRYRSSEDRA